MSEYEITDELPEEASTTDSVPYDFADEVAEPEDEVEEAPEGVIWKRGENGKLYRG
jgi:hypothetical protein